MYYYKLDGDTLTHTLISDTPPEGYVSFGECVDWTQKQYVNGELQDIPQPEPPAPYVPTDAELLEQAKNSKLWRIKGLLAATDYKCLKYADGELTENEYAETKAYRAGLRAAYNAVEAAVSAAEVEAAEV